MDLNSEKIYKEIKRFKFEYELGIRKGERDVPQFKKNDQLYKIQYLYQDLDRAAQDEWRKLGEKFSKGGVNKIEADILLKKSNDLKNYHEESLSWIRKHPIITIKKADNVKDVVKLQIKIDEKILTLKRLFDLISAYSELNSKSYLLRGRDTDGYLKTIKSLEDENERRKTAEQTLDEYKGNLDIDSYNKDFVYKIESNYFKFRETIFEDILELFQPSPYHGWQSWKRDNYENNKEEIDQIKTIMEEADKLKATNEWLDLFLKILMIDEIFTKVRI